MAARTVGGRDGERNGRWSGWKIGGPSRELGKGEEWKKGVEEEQEQDGWKGGIRAHFSRAVASRASLILGWSIIYAL